MASPRSVRSRGKVKKVMGEFKRGGLHSGSKSGPKVKNPKQAKAIALSEARAVTGSAGRRAKRLEGRQL